MTLINDSSYDPNNLLDVLLETLSLKSDAALSRVLGIATPLISNIRHKRIQVGPTLLLRMHEISEISINDLRLLMGDRTGLKPFDAALTAPTNSASL